MATFNAIVCARERHLGAEIRRGVIYTSDQAHHSSLEGREARSIMPDRVRPFVRCNLPAAGGRTGRGGLPPIAAGRTHPVCHRVVGRHDQHRRGGSLDAIADSGGG